jgi:glycine/D-amino acid oxidase-like deaminating enzyme
MKLDSYWTDSAPAFVPRSCELPAQVDVAIVGGGFTGLSAALALAKRGAKVAVLEAGCAPGWPRSSRSSAPRGWATAGAAWST